MSDIAPMALTEDPTQKDPLPFDIICEILTHASSDVRLALSVANREVALEARKLIWSSITISNKKTGSLQGVVDAVDRIAHEKENAKLIKNLRFRVEYSGTTHELFMERLAEKLCVALKCTTQLDKLSLWVKDDPHIIIDQLSLHAKTFEFRISQFNCLLPLSQELVNFLAPQTKLSRFRYEGPKDRTPENIPLDLFPNLSDVKYPPVGIARIVRGRPVQHIIVTLRDVEDVQFLVDGIASSTVPVTCVHINVQEITIYFIVIEKLVHYAPSLTSLTINWCNSLWYQREQYPPEGFIYSLSRCSSLKYLTWQGCALLDYIHLLSPKGYAPPTLREISGKFDHKRQYLYMRENEDQPWVLAVFPAVQTPWWH